jgi:hypothetical protein
LLQISLTVAIVTPDQIGFGGYNSVEMALGLPILASHWG